MLYNVTNIFIKINETSGAIQNTSYIYDIEVSDKAECDSGILLFPLNTIFFKGDIYARCVDDKGQAEARVVSFATDDIIDPDTSGFNFATFEDIQLILNQYLKEETLHG